MKRKALVLSLIVILLLIAALPVQAQQELPVARAILFFSPNCAHCHKVITESLPPLFEIYQDQLLILLVDITTEDGSTVFYNTLTDIGYPPEQAGVPFMLIGDQILIGAAQIPAELPGIVDAALEGDGIQWPQSEALLDMLEFSGYYDSVSGQAITPTPGAEAVAEVQEEEPLTPDQEPTFTPAPTPIKDESSITVIEDEDSAAQFSQDQFSWDFSLFKTRFQNDLTANTIAAILLVIMIGVVIWIGINFMRAAEPKLWPEWVLPLLTLVGFGIATYMSIVEITGSEAICGPVGDCNSVQQSPYATLFGFLHVGVLGMIGNVVLFGSWFAARKTTGQAQFLAKMALLLSAIFGLLFSIYLTFLEPFVIGATCAWCISSAIVMTLMAIYATKVGLNAWAAADEDGLDDEDWED